MANGHIAEVKYGPLVSLAQSDFYSSCSSKCVDSSNLLAYLPHPKHHKVLDTDIVSQCLRFIVALSNFSVECEDELVLRAYVMCPLLQGGFPPLFYRVLRHWNDLPWATKAPHRTRILLHTGIPSGKDTTLAFKVLGVIPYRIGPGSTAPGRTAKYVRNSLFSRALLEYASQGCGNFKSLQYFCFLFCHTISN